MGSSHQYVDQLLSRYGRLVLLGKSHVVGWIESVLGQSDPRLAS